MVVSEVFDVLWALAQPLLFGLIGAEVDLDNIKLSRVGKWLGVDVRWYDNL